MLKSWIVSGVEFNKFSGIPHFDCTLHILGLTISEMNVGWVSRLNCSKTNLCFYAQGLGFQTKRCVIFTLEMRFSISFV